MTATLVDSEVLADAVALACRAPSLHNSQPWRFVTDGVELQLFLDPGRIVHSADRRKRQALISCGAVLDHLTVAMAAAGWASVVDRFPDPGDPEHLATVTFAPMRTTPAHRRRADAILTRRTDRLPMAAPLDWEPLAAMLYAAVDDAVAHLDVLDDDARAELAQASALTETLRMYDSSYHAELYWWTRAYNPVAGIPPSALLSAAETNRVDVARAFPVTDYRQRRPEIAEDQAKIVVLSTDADTRENALRCGEMLSRVLLECTLAGLATCTVTHVTELSATRAVIDTLTSRDTWPQALIRVGVAPTADSELPPTPRRPVRAALTFR
ncbi:Acg family FMN-binding oxidoreductase [Mycolicibacterium pulveris]|uniref:Acg family FMN-binding oxidoreductase n=1 Tax=Mycolicibacterium pulveris TaxID=36813 RepID=UPI003CF88CD1